jgi:uncharacterized protein
MSQRVLLADCAPQPWRNGGGQTQELLAWPHAADWQLRLSVAKVDRNGPFSAFAGVDRWFAVLQGAGLDLHWEGRRARAAEDDEPVCFDGADAPLCRLVDGPTQDLNLMCRRGSGVGRLWRAAVGSVLGGPATLRALYAHEAAELRVGGRLEVLPAACLAWSVSDGAKVWELVDGRRAFWVSWQGG